MSARQHLISQLEMFHNIASSFSEGFSAEQAMVPYAPGGSHLLWLLGHGGSVRTSIRALCTGEAPDDERWEKLFGNGTKCLTDASAYPSLEEVRAGLEERSGSFMDFVRSLDEADLAKPVAHEVPGAPFLKTWADAFNIMIADQLMHTGQILVLRKVVGLVSPFEAMQQGG